MIQTGNCTTLPGEHFNDIRIERLEHARILIPKKICSCCGELFKKVNPAFRLALEAVDCAAKGKCFTSDGVSGSWKIKLLQ